jgi:hypothetical protein
MGADRQEQAVLLRRAIRAGWKRSNPNTTISFVPTQAMAERRFHPDHIARVQRRTSDHAHRPFDGSGNRIDPSRLSSVTPNFLKHVLVSTDPCGRLQHGIPNNNTENQGLGKVDYTINNDQTVFARYFYAFYDNPATYDGSNVLTLSRTGQNNQAHSLVVGHNYIISTNTLNSFHGTFNRTLNDRQVPEYFTPTDLGSNVFSLQPGFTGVTVNGNGFSVGAGATNPGYFNSVGWQMADDLDVIRGDHQLAFGANWIHARIETKNNRPTNGQFTFNGQGTGLPLADFMVGNLSGGFLQGNPVFDYDNSNYIGSHPDNWRVRSNLTLNFGVRWEPSWRSTIPIATSVTLIRTVSTRACEAPPILQAPAGLIFPGTRYPGDAATFSKIAQFAPRLGAGRRVGMSAPACERRGVFMTRRISSSTPVSLTIRRGRRLR